MDLFGFPRCPQCGRRMNYPQLLRTGWGYRCPRCQSILVGPKKHVVVCYSHVVLFTLFSLHMLVFALLGFDRILAWAQDFGVNDRVTFVLLGKMYLYLWLGIWVVVTAITAYSWHRIVLRVEKVTEPGERI